VKISQTESMYLKIISPFIKYFLLAAM